MNRIILIGNGFDKAHGLPTGYDDFINNYWKYIVSELEHCKSYEYKDGLCTLTLLYENITNGAIRTWEDFMRSSRVMRYDTAHEKIEYIKQAEMYCRVQKTSFLSEIDKAIETKKWVDIENKYYDFLKDIATQNRACKYNSVEELNKELEILKSYLIAYLNDIRLDDRIVMPCIRQTMYGPFIYKEVSIEKEGVFWQFVKDRWDKANSTEDDDKIGFLAQFGEHFAEEEFNTYKRMLTLDEHMRNIFENTEVPNYYLLPNSVMLLDFNYTATSSLYINKLFTQIPRLSLIEINHIHGELSGSEEIIFGYGDDIDEEYARIERLNENAYLDNIKVFHYLSSPNYRRMLEFIESAPYQIYIMGHSCGTSDRTLLNTLFEHDNCVSIKPFYYQKEDGSDNYRELVQNISRNFKDKRLMRDKVVNKKYCEPLPQIGK